MNELNKVDMLLEKASITLNTKDYYELFEELRGVEVFFHTKTQINEKTGNEDTVIGFTPVNNNDYAIVAYIHKSNEKLTPGNYAGMKWEYFLETVLPMKKVQAVIIQGNKSTWASVNKKTIENLVSIHKQLAK